MLSFGDLNRKYFNSGVFSARSAATGGAAQAFGSRSYSVQNSVDGDAATPKQQSSDAKQLYERAVRKEMGPIASARRVQRYKGNFKYLAGVMAVFLGIYYYSIWKVGQDDFSDVDSEGNVREKV